MKYKNRKSGCQKIHEGFSYGIKHVKKFIAVISWFLMSKSIRKSAKYDKRHIPQVSYSTTSLQYT
jgi:hypothetical protein